MNLSHDALKDLTAHAELKAEGGILERHFLLLKGHGINDHRRHVDVPSLEETSHGNAGEAHGCFDRRSGVSCEFGVMGAMS